MPDNPHHRILALEIEVRNLRIDVEVLKAKDAEREGTIALILKTIGCQNESIVSQQILTQTLDDRYDTLARAVIQVQIQTFPEKKAQYEELYGEDFDVADPPEPDKGGEGGMLN